MVDKVSWTPIEDQYPSDQCRICDRAWYVDGLADLDKTQMRPPRSKKVHIERMTIGVSRGKAALLIATGQRTTYCGIIIR